MMRGTDQLEGGCRQWVDRLSVRLASPGSWIVALVMSVALTLSMLWGVQGHAPGAISAADGPVDVRIGPDSFSHPAGAAPGGRFIIAPPTEGTTVSVCSVGWPATSNGVRGFITARHCLGGVDPLRIDIPVSEDSVVRSVGTPRRGKGSDDIAFVPFPSASPGVRGLYLLGKPVSSTPATLEWLVRTRPTVCRVGQTTGMACGAFRGVSNARVYFDSNTEHGDSGGAVFALTDDAAVPVGVVSALEGSATVAQPFGSYFDSWSLSL